MARRKRRDRGNPQEKSQHDGGTDASSPQEPQRRPRGHSERLTAQANARAAAKAGTNGAAADNSPRILVYALVIVATLTGLYMHAYALPQLKYFAAGQSMPDARPLGFDAADLESLRTSFTDEAAGQLAFLHITAGVVFPVAFFLAAWAVMGLLTRGRGRWLVVAGAAVFAAVYITSNALTDHALGDENPSSELVRGASLATTASWVLMVLVGAALLTVIIRDLATMRRGTAT